MANKTLIIIFSFILTSCGQIRTENKEKLSIHVDKSAIAILPFDTTQYWIFKNSKPYTLTNADLIKIEKLLEKCINEYYSEQVKQYNEFKAKYSNSNIDKQNFVIDLTKYKRQYIAITNENEEKEVWINCFCNTWDKKWKENLIFVLDGGNCYFNLKINLTTEVSYDLMVNGEA